MARVKPPQRGQPKLGIRLPLGSSPGAASRPLGTSSPTAQYSPPTPLSCSPLIWPWLMAQTKALNRTQA
ncbi:hypothetical protein D3C80_2091130 [compost metagenome]